MWLDNWECKVSVVADNLGIFRNFPGYLGVCRVVHCTHINGGWPSNECVCHAWRQHVCLAFTNLGQSSITSWSVAGKSMVGIQVVVNFLVARALGCVGIQKVDLSEVVFVTCTLLVLDWLLSSVGGWRLSVDGVELKLFLRRTHIDRPVDVSMFVLRHSKGISWLFLVWNKLLSSFLKTTRRTAFKRLIMIKLISDFDSRLRIRSLIKFIMRQYFTTLVTSEIFSVVISRCGQKVWETFSKVC